MLTFEDDVPATPAAKAGPGLVARTQALSREPVHDLDTERQAAGTGRVRLLEIPGLVLCKSEYEACEDADVLVLVTEWNQFRMLDLERVRRLLREPVVVDLRNVYDPEAMRNAGFRYEGVGRP